jgi:hypothetical protein
VLTFAPHSFLAPGDTDCLKHGRPPRFVASVPFIVGYHAVFADMSSRWSICQRPLAQASDAGATKKVLPPPAAVENLHCVLIEAGRRIKEAVPSGIDRSQGFVTGRAPRRRQAKSRPLAAEMMAERIEQVWNFADLEFGAVQNDVAVSPSQRRTPSLGRPGSPPTSRMAARSKRPPISYAGNERAERRA